MFKHRMEIVHNYGNGYRAVGCFTRTFFPQRESTSIMSFNGKVVTIQGLFKSLFTEL